MARRTYHGPKAATFTALDKLPAALRQEVVFAARVYDAVDLVPHYKRAMADNGVGPAVEWLTRCIRANDEAAVQALDRAYRHSCGHPLPHVAADATILRYKPVCRFSRRLPIIRANPASRRALASCARLLPRFAA